MLKLDDISYYRLTSTLDALAWPMLFIGVFRTLSNIWDGVFCEMFDWVLNTTLFLTGLRPAALWQKKLQYRCFPVDLTKFLRTPLLRNTSWKLSLELGYPDFFGGKVEVWPRCNKFIEGKDSKPYWVVHHIL